jgi:hypothetical protein
MVHFRTLSDCFKHFGAVCASRRYSRSAISKDGQTVVVAMWDDEIRREGGRIIYETRYKPALKGKSRGVDSECIANLKWACAHCGRLVRVVILTAKDSGANPRAILYCYPDDSLVMRITYLNIHTGAFRAENA